VPSAPLPRVRYDPPMLLALLILGVALVLNGIFASAELAVMTSRTSRLQHAASRGSRGASAALALKREPTRFLSTVQIGITLIGIFAGAYGEAAISEKIRPLIEDFAFAKPYARQIAFALSVIVGELVPKRLAMAFPEGIASRIARPLRLLSRLAAPAVKILSVATDSLLALVPAKPRTDDVSEDDIKALVARAATTGVFDPTEHALFQRLFRLGDLKVQSLMVPRHEIIPIEHTMSLDDVRVLVGTSPHSHFPVIDGSLDKLVGVVHIKDLIAYGLLSSLEFKVTDVARKPLFVPEAMPAVKLLDTFQKSKTHVAFVVDEFGGVEGLVTLNDLFQIMVGDLTRVGEEPPPKARRRRDGSYLLDGMLPLHDGMVALGLPDPDPDRFPNVTTVAGLVVTILGHVPDVGEVADYQGWRLEVVDMDNRRVDQVLAFRGHPTTAVQLPSRSSEQ
jgi:putative hemolysin